MDALRPDASRGPSWLAAFLHGLSQNRPQDNGSYAFYNSTPRPFSAAAIPNPFEPGVSITASPTAKD